MGPPRATQESMLEQDSLSSDTHQNHIGGPGKREDSGASRLVRTQSNRTCPKQISWSLGYFIEGSKLSHLNVLKISIEMLRAERQTGDLCIASGKALSDGSNGSSYLGTITKVTISSNGRVRCSPARTTARNPRGRAN
jgi:hypothetical protein